ncbi:MAG: hypothetical protein Phog2KO_18860 [Phototrophicaceae bacterium]
MPDPLQLIGKTIQNYTVIDYLATGGTAHIYVGEYDKELVILKLLRHELIQEPDAKQRFHKEVYTLKQLDHPNIIKLLGEGRYQHDPFMVLEYSELGSLQDMIDADNVQLTLGDVAKIIQQLADALHHIHEKNFIHRDVKPSNIMMRDAHNIMLADFGIVRHDDVDRRFDFQPGTLDFMASEQIDGLNADYTTDQFALAVVAYLLITGERPFHAENRVEAARQRREKILSPRTINSELPIELDDILFRAMHPDMTERYTFIEEFAHHLAQLIYAKNIEHLPALGKSDTKISITQTVEIPSVLQESKTRKRYIAIESYMERYSWIGITVLSMLLIGIFAYIAINPSKMPENPSRLSYIVLSDLIDLTDNVEDFSCDEFTPLYNEIVSQVNTGNYDYDNFSSLLNDDTATRQFFTTYCVDSTSQNTTAINIEMWNAMHSELQTLYTVEDR